MHPPKRRKHPDQHTGNLRVPPFDTKWKAGIYTPHRQPHCYDGTPTPHRTLGSIYGTHFSHHFALHPLQICYAGIHNPHPYPFVPCQSKDDKPMPP
jgi:hypothetical protein